jgi:hypothetical protein
MRRTHHDRASRHGPHTMKSRNTSLIAWASLLLACTLFLPRAYGVEHAEDATGLYELGQYASAAAGLEKQFLSLIESASGEERLNLYWTYNHLTGARVQVDLLQSQLQLSIAVPAYLDEHMARTTLRDQAQFVAWELDNALTDLELSMPELMRSSHVRINQILRSLLSAARTTVSRLAAG